MKIRTDFVTNSSSSSFICEICGDVEAGYDLSLSDAGMIQCEIGHTFCASHITKIDKKELYKLYLTNEINKSYTSSSERLKLSTEIGIIDELDEDYMDEKLEEDYEYPYDFPSEFCPICQLNSIPKNLAIKYLYKKYNLNEKIIRDEIKSKFKNYDDFCNYTK